MSAYRPRFPAACRDLSVRGLRYRVNCWGDPAAPPLVLLHGWADTGMSYQFLADELAADRYCIAPDWRGFGRSEWAPAGYWFPDYLADLDQLLDVLELPASVPLVGHSMGGNVAWLYAGTRPQRLSHVVSLDAFGMRDTDPDAAPERYGQWLGELRAEQRFGTYADLAAATGRVMQLAPRLDADRAQFIAASWTQPLDDGRLALQHDPRHKRVNPVLYRRAEVKACWRRISAPVLLVLGRDSHLREIWAGQGAREEVHECLPTLQESVLDGGHMLHMEKPMELAALLKAFLATGAVPAE